MKKNNNIQLANVRESGKYLTELLSLVYKEVKAGVRLLDLEDIAEKYMQKHKLKWAFKGYHGFPCNLCLSVNDCIVHGIPDEYVLKNWDFLKVDCGVIYKWWITDSAFSIVVWWDYTNPQAAELSKVTKEALDLAVPEIQAGVSIYNFGKVVSDYVTSHDFTIIKNLTGHGVWSDVHEEPYIYNYAEPQSRNIRFEEGSVVAVEPITAITSKKSVERAWIAWNLYTVNGDIGAHWEYEIIVGPNGPEIVSGLVDVKL